MTLDQLEHLLVEGEGPFQGLGNDFTGHVILSGTETAGYYHKQGFIHGLS